MSPLARALEKANQALEDTGPLEELRRKTSKLDAVKREDAPAIAQEEQERAQTARVEVEAQQRPPTWLERLGLA